MTVFHFNHNLDTKQKLLRIVIQNSELYNFPNFKGDEATIRGQKQTKLWNE